MQLAQMHVCADCAAFERLQQILALSADDTFVANAVERLVLGGASPAFFGRALLGFHQRLAKRLSTFKSTSARSQDQRES